MIGHKLLKSARDFAGSQLDEDRIRMRWRVVPLQPRVELTGLRGFFRRSQ